MAVGTHQPADADTEVKSPVKFIGRQPILDRRQRTFGYELLFRLGTGNFYDGSSQNPTLALIADSLLFHTVEKLTNHCKAFVNFDREALLGGYSSLLPKELTVIEVLETVEPDAEVLAVLGDLKSAGYALSLDDVSSLDRALPFLDVIQFAKVDMTLTTPEQRRELGRVLKERRIQPVAEKVETQEQFREMDAMGFLYFQGYFFAKPEIISSRDIAAFKLNYVRLLHAINQPHPDPKRLEPLIKHEEAFCYKLLRYLNSPVFGFQSTIRSVNHAISLLGEREIKRWASMLAVTTLAGDKPQELVLMSLRRGFFCELLAPSLGMASRKDDLFLLGLLSLIDAILDQPRAEILRQLPLNEDIKKALVEGNTHLARVLEVVEAYDEGGWNRVASIAATLRLKERVLLQAYMKSLTLSHEAMRLS